MVGLLIVSLVIGTIWTPKTRGKSLEEITREQYGDKFLTDDEKSKADRDTAAKGASSSVAQEMMNPDK
jgi:inositol transporter-like SP family MFS transporter